LGQFQEWQETQYLPGYWLGGNIPPYITGKRPNKYGYVLLASGLASGLIVALIARSGFTLDSLLCL
jgi:hypothetical protein